MSDNDPIRRNDAIQELTMLPIFSEYVSDGKNADAVIFISKASKAIRALPAADPMADSRVVALVKSSAMTWQSLVSEYGYSMARANFGQLEDALNTLATMERPHE